MRCLTFELTGRQRRDARPGLAKMYRVPPDRAWWPAVGAPVERGESRKILRQEIICRFWNQVGRGASAKLIKLSKVK